MNKAKAVHRTTAWRRRQAARFLPVQGTALSIEYVSSACESFVVPLRDSLQINQRQASAKASTSAALDSLLNDAPLNDGSVPIASEISDEPLDTASDSSISGTDGDHLDEEIVMEEDLRNFLSK
jgi:hypothetical protein